MKTARERAEENRQVKLAHVREQVANGSLVIRPMTAEERDRYPPRPWRPTATVQPPGGSPTSRGPMSIRKPERLICATCGEVVGTHEPAFVEHPEGTLHSSALLNLDAKTRRNAHAIWHAACYEAAGSSYPTPAA